MKRFITYLFGYEDGNKCKNIGFVRTDIRNDICRMEIYVQNLSRFQGKARAYLLAKGEAAEGIELGTMVLTQGKGEGAFTFSTKSIMESRYDFFNICGVGIRFGNQQYAASFWEDDADIVFLTGKYAVWTKEPQGEDLPERNQQKKEDAKLPERNMPKKAGAELPERNMPKKAGTELRSDLQKTPEETVREKEEAGKAVADDEKMPEATGKEKMPEETDGQDAGTDAAENMAGRQESCRKIDINGIRTLPKKNWYLCNNSFLIHGFFNYHYLLVKETECDNQKKRYLGVPGRYARQEKMMAAMFGFPEFEAENPTEPVTEGTFGHWFCLLDV